MNNVFELLGRTLLGLIFVAAGYGKIGAGYAGTAGYMESMGLPGSLLPFVIVFEIVAGLMVITGFKVKWAAYTLAGFTIVTAVIFHSNFADQMQSILFMKNLAISGGLLLLATYGAGKLSIESKFK